MSIISFMSFENGIHTEHIGLLALLCIITPTPGFSVVYKPVSIIVSQIVKSTVYTMSCKHAGAIRNAAVSLQVRIMLSLK